MPLLCAVQFENEASELRCAAGYVVLESPEPGVLEWDARRLYSAAVLLGFHSFPPPMGNSIQYRLGNMACHSALDHVHRCLLHYPCIGGRSGSGIMMWTDWCGLGNLSHALAPTSRVNVREEASARLPLRRLCAAQRYLGRPHGMIRK